MKNQMIALVAVVVGVAGPAWAQTAPVDFLKDRAHGAGYAARAAMECGRLTPDDEDNIRAQAAIESLSYDNGLHGAVLAQARGHAPGQRAATLRMRSSACSCPLAGPPLARLRPGHARIKNRPGANPGPAPRYRLPGCSPRRT